MILYLIQIDLEVHNSVGWISGFVLCGSKNIFPLLRFRTIRTNIKIYRRCVMVHGCLHTHDEIFLFIYDSM